MKSILSIAVAVALLATPAFGQVWIIGPATNGSGGGGGWDMPADLIALTETDPNSGLWEYSDWDEFLFPLGEFAYNENDFEWNKFIESGNQWVNIEIGELTTVTFDTNTYDDGWMPAQYRVKTSRPSTTWTAVGQWQHFVGGDDWTNDNPNTAMTETSPGSGIYELSFTGVDAGNYEFKAVVTGSWNAIGADSVSVNAGTTGLVVGSELDQITVRVDAVNGTIWADVQTSNVVKADLDGDRDVDFDDLNILLSVYGQTY